MQGTYVVRLTKRVAGDLEQIHSYVSHESEQNAPALVAKLFDAMQSLSEFPHRYPVYSGHPQPSRQVRRMAVGNYLIYFRILESGRAVEIIHVRHGARRQPPRFP
jgi:plasmid stabilization system protein ParE